MSGPAGDPPERCDIAVVGGGIVGLAVARELTLRFPDASLCLLEREREELACHQTAHNSGVIHAGVYYEPGSLKARLCVEGSRMLYSYCERNGIAHSRCGKLILATRAHELPRLEQLERRARANGVRGVRLLERGAIAELEPHARGLAALHSPDTGVVDFREVALAYARDASDAGALFATGCEVRSVSLRRSALELAHSRGLLHARHAVFCAGAWADRIAVRCGAPADPRIVPVRGAYLRLLPERSELVRALIYPVPDPALPFLGVHLTRHIDGEVTVGPTALLAGARDERARGALRREDLLDTLSWPGTWRMLARTWRPALGELRRAAARSAVVREAARFVPELEPRDVEPAFAGVRAQALARDGRLLDDFVISAGERALHVRNAPSPAATSSLAIARVIADEAARSFGLARG